MKILAVCGFGVGSSMVLKMSLDKVIKELGLKATVENTDLSTAKATMADVYFTSHELLPERFALSNRRSRKHLTNERSDWC